MLSFLNGNNSKRNKICILCSKQLTNITSSPDNCKDLFHYRCLRKYADDRLVKNKSVTCPEKDCSKIFGRIATKLKNSIEIIYQSVVLSTDENQCCICFSKFKIPVASSDTCTHTFCYDCIKKWCTFKHECPMDRMPIKLLLISDFPGGHVTDRIEPPAIEENLNADEENDELINTACEICNTGQDEDQLLLCDNCDKGYHIYCLPEPLSSIPEGDWFCEDCQAYATNPEDTNVVPGRRMPRGLGRVLSNLQTRLSRDNISQNAPRRRNNNVTRITSTQRPRINRFNFETDRHVTDISPPIMPNTSHFISDAGAGASNGIMTRRVAKRSNVHVRESFLSEGRDSSVEQTSISSFEDSSSVTESDTDDSILHEVKRTKKVHNVIHRTPKLVAQHGSLSSNFESENEPKRTRKKKVKYTELTTFITSNEESLSDDLYCPGPSSSSITKRHKSIQQLLHKESPIVKSRKPLKRIFEDSGSDMGFNDYNNIRQQVMQDEEIKLKRARQISTHSPVSTVSCRISESIKSTPTLDGVPKSVNKKARLIADDQKMVPKSRTTKIAKKITLIKKNLKKKKYKRKSKSIKNRKTTIKKPKKVRRKVSKPKTKRRITSTISEIEHLVPQKLSISGRENNLLPFCDEEITKDNKALLLDQRTNKKIPCINTNILSEIDKRQNNFKNISLSTIQRLSDGTVIYKDNKAGTSSARLVSEQSSKDLNSRVRNKDNELNNKESIPLNGVQAKINSFKDDIPKSSNSINFLKNSIKNEYNEEIKKQCVLKDFNRDVNNKDNIKCVHFCNENSKEQSNNCNELNIKNNLPTSTHKVNFKQLLMDSLKTEVTNTNNVTMVPSVKPNNTSFALEGPATVRKIFEPSTISSNFRHLPSSQNSFMNSIEKKMVDKCIFVKNISTKVNTPQTFNIPSISIKTVESSTSKVNSYSSEIHTFINNALSNYYSKGKINKAELDVLNERIYEKILKREIKIPEEGKVKSFVDKYTNHYLIKKSLTNR